MDGERVYFIGEVTDDGRAFSALKIGYVGPGQDVSARMATLQTGNPRELRLHHHFGGSEAEEHFLHYFFRIFKIRGEWVRPEQPIFDFVARCYAQRKLDLVWLAQCTWSEDAEARRSRTLATCSSCPQCHRQQPPEEQAFERELLERIEGRKNAPIER